MTGFTKTPELSLVERLRALASIYERDALAVVDIENDAAWPVNAHVVDVVSEAADALAEQAAVREELCGALRLLVADVADYDAWARPCHALDVARAALAKATPEQSEE